MKTVNDTTQCTYVDTYGGELVVANTACDAASEDLWQSGLQEVPTYVPMYVPTYVLYVYSTCEWRGYRRC